MTSQNISTPSAFDGHRPPSSDLLSDCVHCGFCLTTCPTYALWGEEMDSPRGRIHLMKNGLEGAPLSEEMVGHFDACLGCMACVTSCPSGVQYDRLIEQTRAQVERRHTRPRSERALRSAIFSLFPYPSRLRALRGPLRLAQRLGIEKALRNSTLLQRISPQLAAMQRLTPQLGPREPLPERIPATGTKRATVAILTGCVQREFFSGVNAATARVLAAEGCEVLVPSAQGCCGALSGHSGREPEAQDFARSTIETFEQFQVDYIVVNAAGCGSAMKEYDFLLAEDADLPGGIDPSRVSAFTAKVRDLSEILVDLGPRATYHPLQATAAYHDACHLGHAQGIRTQPRDLLRGIPGLTVKEIPEGSLCCGSAGVYNILNPKPAAELGDRKLRNIRSTGAELLITANPGCLMQIAQAMERDATPIAMAHTAVVLDASQRGLPVEELLSAAP
ncbi:(Fe-S)-binding protein [Demetria terragena]|uniref:(Fe-S)-binding protein n=1 Tax=Demetria terragena TaxID=63959 RepID=UPI000363538A|nr:heterodisulfide reductase-related iron-sulfur binding cluster [Demetria terragena]